MSARLASTLNHMCALQRKNYALLWYKNELFNVNIHIHVVYSTSVHRNINKIKKQNRRYEKHYVSK